MLTQMWISNLKNLFANVFYRQMLSGKTHQKFDSEQAANKVCVGSSAACLDITLTALPQHSQPPIWKIPWQVH